MNSKPASVQDSFQWLEEQLKGTEGKLSQYLSQDQNNKVEFKL